MLTIYGVYRSRASRNIWMAHELGIPFQHVPVLQAYRSQANPATGSGAPLQTNSPEFLRVNPNGRIPSIEDDGFVMHQSLAINLYLARKHGGPLAPASTIEDGLMTMWTLWAATEVESHALQIIYHRVGKPPAERDPAIAAAGVKALVAPFAVLDQELAQQKQAGSDYIVGGRFTVADLNLAEVFRYAQAAPELFQAAPHVAAWIARCQSRPGFREMMRAREAEPA